MKDVIIPATDNKTMTIKLLYAILVAIVWHKQGDGAELGPTLRDILKTADLAVGTNNSNSPQQDQKP